jgi:hypothetical protein
VRRYAEGTQETTDPALNAADMVGITVATMTESRLDTTTHSASPVKMGRSFLKGKRFVWSVSSTCPLGVVLPGVFTAVLSSEGADIALMQENGEGEGGLLAPGAGGNAQRFLKEGREDTRSKQTKAEKKEAEREDTEERISAHCVIYNGVHAKRGDMPRWVTFEW